ncbi:hypothetical protein CK203_002335 [Vitis vinifera]|uniref:Uncharacterized protein n=1 Tax=Vitis vinifera TaxID=29760 RepID=A0A438KK80_VITVI|nr:hypothetical protein CK203_002335 [Vitis vinifera]
MTMTPFTSLLQVLFKHLQEKLYVTETKLKESQFQLAPWRSDVNHSNFSPQSPPHSIGAALTTSIKNGLELVPQPAYSPGMIPSSSDVQTPSNWNIPGHHQSGFGGMAKNLESEDLGRYSPPASRMADTDRRGNFGGLLKRLNKVVGMMIEQAHDHVNWDFSFGDKMYGALKKWMEKIFCTSMVQLQFLSMGLLQVSLEFEGLRQGNSLSLFVPADVEMVSCFISVAVEEVLSVASNWKEEVLMRLRFPIFWPRINLDMNELISMGGMEDLGILTSEKQVGEYLEIFFGAVGPREGRFTWLDVILFVLEFRDGLGIRRLSIIKKAPLWKWLWRFGEGRRMGNGGLALESVEGGLWHGLLRSS